MEPQDETGALRAEALRLRPLIAVSTPLFGRDADLAEVTRLFSEQGVRLLTLTGAGGAGKTRLASAAAVRVAVEFPDGVSFVDLSAVDDPALVPASIAQQLGIQESGGRPVEAILIDVLADRALLLVLDNFEQVLSAVRFVSDLLAGCPRLGLLVTSREPLHLRAERVLPVRPLPLPDPHVLDARTAAANPAVAMFIDRGKACRPSFQLTDENVPAVVEICTRMDGLPLAIELAAAQLGVLSPQAISERLRARSPFVLSGVADLPARHRTLRAAVSTSYELLSPEQRAVFRWSAVFAGGFTSAAAGAVMVDGDEVQDLLPVLATLADKNLLQVSEDPDGQPRFRWLETIRSYAIDLLTLTGELPIARRRHAEYYLAVAEAAEPSLTGRNMSAALDTLEREYDNFRAVFHWALEGEQDDLGIGLRVAGAMFRFWMVRGHLGEARQWLERAIPRSQELSPTIRARALNAAGVIAGMQADNDHAETWFQEGLALWRQIGDTTRVAATIGNLGLVAENRQQLDRAAELFLESQALYEVAGDQRGIAISLGARALLERQKGHVTEAVSLLEQSVVLFRELGDDRSLANSLANLGHSTLALGDAKRSVAYFSESLRLRESLGNTLDIAECLEGFAAIASIGGRPRRAAQLYGAAEALRESTGAKHLVPVDRAERERQVEDIRRRLGAHTFMSEWAIGRAMLPDDAARLAVRVAGIADDDGAESGSRRGTLLTRREREVAVLVARGLTNRQAAEQLLVAPRTVETHLEHIFAKLGVQTRAEVAAWAARRGDLE